MHGDERTQAVCVGGYSRCLLKCQAGPCCSEGFPVALMPCTRSSDSYASWWIITLFGDSPCKYVYSPCESRSRSIATSNPIQGGLYSTMFVSLALKHGTSGEAHCRLLIR
jgi:hypothetical protein